MEHFGYYLKTAWGRISLISILFPFAGKLFIEIPFPNYINPTKAWLITSLINSFLIALIYTARYKLNIKKSILSIIIAFASSILYTNENFQNIFIYITIFASITSSFAILGAIDYKNRYG